MYRICHQTEKVVGKLYQTYSRNVFIRQKSKALDKCCSSVMINHVNSPTTDEIQAREVCVQHERLGTIGNTRQESPLVRTETFHNSWHSIFTPALSVSQLRGYHSQIPESGDPEVRRRLQQLKDVKEKQHKSNKRVMWRMVAFFTVVYAVVMTFIYSNFYRSKEILVQKGEEN